MAWLLDVNVVVAILHARHRHCAAAVTWLEARDEPACLLVCRVAQMGALRILTNPAVMRDEAKTGGEFWAGWDVLMADDRFTLAAEPPGFEATWREMTRSLPAGRCAETDAYFAALARAGGWRLATFDSGLDRFKGVELDILA